MEYVFKTSNGYIKVYGWRNEYSVVKDKEKATPFTNKDEARRFGEAVLEIESRYIKCKECKNCNLMRTTGKTGKQVKYLTCKKQVGVFPFKAQFINCKHYYKADEKTLSDRKQDWR